jgi:hypothetical protein
MIAVVDPQGQQLMPVLMGEGNAPVVAVLLASA